MPYQGRVNNDRKIICNRYEIIAKLGAGGMANVYKARCTILNRIVTVKILRSELAEDKDFVRRFQNEAQAVALLSHPNIVSIYDVRGEWPAIFGNGICGRENLKELIRSEGALLLQSGEYRYSGMCCSWSCSQ